MNDPKPYEGAVAMMTLVVAALAVLASRISNITPATRSFIDVAAGFGFLSVFAVISGTALSIGGKWKQFGTILIGTSLVCLALAVYAAGFGAEIAVVHPQLNPPSFTVTRTTDATGSSRSEPEVTITVTGNFYGLSSGEVATAEIVNQNTNQVVASSAASSTPNGTATIMLTVSHIPITEQVTLDGFAGKQNCKGNITSQQSAPDLKCEVLRQQYARF